MPWSNIRSTPSVDSMEEKILNDTKDDPNQLLRQAIIHDNETWFGQAVANGADPDALANVGEPMIIIAAQPSKLALVEKLVALGANPNDKLVFEAAIGSKGTHTLQYLLSIVNCCDGAYESALNRV
ncbi:MAG: hypothetical protein ACJAX5_000065 [Patiriisocius sp.]|jgi:hypothetical protein